MTDESVRRLGLILAVQAEIDGMKAENANRLSNDYAPAYVDDDFKIKAEELSNLAYAHDMQLFG